MRKIYTYLTVVCASFLMSAASYSASAQDLVGGTAFNNDIMNWTDLYNLSFTSHSYGTARSMSMGNAFTALGADLVSASVNPAGIGMYTRSDVSFTPMMQFTKSPMKNSEPYYVNVPKSEQHFSDHTERFGMASIGGVFTVFRSTGALTNFNMGFVYNRIADFNSNTLSASIANEAKSSMANMLCTFSNINDLQLSPDGSMPFANPYDWGAVLAYKTYITNKDDQGWYIDSIDEMLAEVDQYSSIETRGSLGEYAFTFGFNFIDKLYLGTTIGIQSLEYKRNMYYGENYIYPYGQEPSGSEMPYQLEFMNYMQQTRIWGTGINIKFGAVVRPVDFLRIGIAYHSPTYFNASLRYSGEMVSCTRSVGDNPDGFVVAPDGRIYHHVFSGVWEDSGEFSWNYRTPSRLLTGVSLVLAKRVTLSVDYERSWYQSIRLQANPLGWSYTDTMKELFKGSNTVRVGVEGYLLPFLALRAGYIWNGSTIRSEYEGVVFTQPIPEQQQYISAGLGVKFNEFVYLDLAYQYGRTEYTPFKVFYCADPLSLVDSRTFSYHTDRHIALLTLGFRF